MAHQLNARRVSAKHSWVLRNFSKYTDSLYCGPNPASGTFYPCANVDQALSLQFSITDSDLFELSVFVHKLSTFEASSQVNCQLSILDQDGNQNFKAQADFGKKDFICNFTNFIHLKDIFNSSLMPNDTLTLFAEITMDLSAKDANPIALAVPDFKEAQVLKPLHHITSHSESFTTIPEYNLKAEFPFVLGQLPSDGSFFLSETYPFGYPDETIQFCLCRVETLLKLFMIVSKNCKIRYGVSLDSGPESTAHHTNEKQFIQGRNLLCHYNISEEYLQNLNFHFELTSFGSPVTEHFEEHKVADLLVCEDVIKTLGLDQRAQNKSLPIANVKWQFNDGTNLFAHYLVLKDRSNGNLLFNQKINTIQFSCTPWEVGRDLLFLVYTRKILSIKRELYPELLYIAEKFGMYKEAFDEIALLFDNDAAFHLLVLATVRNVASLKQEATLRLGKKIADYPLLARATNTVFLFSGNVSLNAHQDVILSAKSPFLENLYKYNPENRTESGIYLFKLPTILHVEFDDFAQDLYFGYYQKDYPMVNHEKKLLNLKQFLLLSDDLQDSILTIPPENESTLVTFEFEDGSLDFVKNDLASISQWFSKKVAEMDEKGQNLLQFPEWKMESFENISKNFLEKSTRDNFTLIESLIIANIFGMKKLKLACESEMCSELRVDSAIKMLLIGANHSEQLKQYAIKYISRYIDQIVDTQEFIELNQNHSDLVCEIVIQLKSDLDDLKNRVSAWLRVKVINDQSIRRLVMGNEDDCRLTGEGCNFINEYLAEIISSDEFQKLTDERSDLNSEIFSTFNLSLADLKKRLSWKGDNELILTKIKRVQVYMSDQDYCVR